MAQEVHVGSDLSKRKLPLRTLLIAAAVVVAAGAAGVGARYWQSHIHTRSATPVTPKTKAQLAQDKALSGDVTGAQQQIEAELKKPNLSADDKYQLYFQQGANYQNQGNDQAALESFKLAAAAKQTNGLYEAMAVVSQALGDKPGAIAYYKLAIQYISPNNPIGEDLKKNYQQAITDLGGQP